MGDKKMSKSLGNVADLELLCEQYGADPVRFYLTRHMAITQDSSFTIEDLEQKITSDLANDLGNLLNRMLLLAKKHDLSDIKAPPANGHSGTSFTCSRALMKWKNISRQWMNVCIMSLLATYGGLLIK